MSLEHSLPVDMGVECSKQKLLREVSPWTTRPALLMWDEGLPPGTVASKAVGRVEQIILSVAHGCPCTAPTPVAAWVVVSWDHCRRVWWAGSNTMPPLHSAAKPPYFPPAHIPIHPVSNRAGHLTPLRSQHPRKAEQFLQEFWDTIASQIGFSLRLCDTVPSSVLVIITEFDLSFTSF